MMNESTPLYGSAHPVNHQNRNVAVSSADHLDSLEFDIEDEFEDGKEPDKRRWSVLTKLQNRHYMGQIRSYTDCCRILSCKCFLATGMLVAFILLLFYVPEYFVRELPDRFGPDEDWNSRYDVIIVGAGAAGSLLAAQLGNEGLDVLLLEAGGSNVVTAVSGPADVASLSSFPQIPFMWPTVAQFSQYLWPWGAILLICILYLLFI